MSILTKLQVNSKPFLVNVGLALLYFLIPLLALHDDPLVVLFYTGFIYTFHIFGLLILIFFRGKAVLSSIAGFFIGAGICYVIFTITLHFQQKNTDPYSPEYIENGNVDR